MLLNLTLADLAEILRGWWGVLGLSLVKVLERLVEMRLNYMLKTAKNWRKTQFVVLFYPMAQLAARPQQGQTG